MKSATAGIPSATETAVVATGSLIGLKADVVKALINVNGNEMVCNARSTSTA